MEGWKKWISESQERAVVSVALEDLEESLAILARRNVEATVLGTFTNNKMLVVYNGDEKIIDLSYDFLENGLPTQKFEAKWEKPQRNEIEPGTPVDWIAALESVFSDGDCASKEEIQRRYDYGVQGTTVLAPFTGVSLDCPNDAVIKAPLRGKPYGFVEAAAKDPRLSYIDPYQGSINTATLAMAKFVAHGGNPNEAYWINNYISGKVRTPEMMGLMHRCVKGVCAAMDAYKTPVISGKDSFSSSHEKEHVLPYVAISVSGPIPDIGKTVSSDIKEIGSTVVLVGQLDSRMGGSVFNKIHGVVGNELPEVDTQVANQVFSSVHQAIQAGKVSAAKAVSEGGVVKAVGEMCFGGHCGINIQLSEGIEPEKFLFNETPGTFVIEVKDAAEAEELFGNVPYQVLGATSAVNNLKATNGNEELFSASMNLLKRAWKKPMGRIFA